MHVGLSNRAILLICSLHEDHSRIYSSQQNKNKLNLILVLQKIRYQYQIMV